MATTNLLTWGTKQILSSESIAANVTATIQLNNARHADLWAKTNGGTHVGTIAVYESYDGTTENAAITFVAKGTGVAASSVAVSNGAASDVAFEIETDAPYLIWKYTATSGTGSVNLWATIKE